MNGNTYLAFAAAVALMLSACGNSDVSDTKGSTATAPVNEAAASAKPQPKSEPAYEGAVAKPGAPFTMKYRVIGTPIVGSPVSVDLRVESQLGAQPITVNYRVNDKSAMMFHEAQPERVQLEPAANENFILQRVTVIPQREGRTYLNVSASFDTEEGSMSTTIAVPIQVGEGGRQLEEQGEVRLDEDGEAVRVLSGD